MSTPRRGGRRPATTVPAAPTWSARALRDLDEIQDHIAEDDPRAALRWALVLWEAADAAAQRPAVGRTVPEVGRTDVREVLRRAYRIIYSVRDEGIVVLAIIEGHRLLPADLRRDIDRS